MKNILFKTLSAVALGVVLFSGVQANTTALREVHIDDENIFNKFSFSFDLEDAMKALSGDTVGNGRVLEDDDFYDHSFDDLFLSPEELEEFNERFQQWLNELGIDPREMRSGDTVGNGGGLLESQAAYSLVSLPKHIISAFEQSIVDFSDLDREVLMKILSGLSEKSSADKIIFMSEENHPGFFFTEGVDPAPRVAKTGFSLDFPIFINRDLVYQRKGLNSRFWIGLLIHEMGHQVGVRNHGYLDQLGAKVVAVSEMNRTELQFILPPRNPIEVSFYNHDFIEGTPDFSVSFNGVHHAVSDWQNQSLKRVCGYNLTYSGLSLSNLHWKNRGVRTPKADFSLAAGAWAEVKCMDGKAGVFFNRVVDIEIILNFHDGIIDSSVQVVK